VRKTGFAEFFLFFALGIGSPEFWSAALAEPSKRKNKRERRLESPTRAAVETADEVSSPALAETGARGTPESFAVCDFLFFGIS